MNKTALHRLLLLIIILLMHGCEPPPESLPVLRIGYAQHDHHAPLYIAAMNPAYFQAHGGIYLKEIRFRQEYELISGKYPLARVLLESNLGGKDLIRRLSEEQFDISFGGVPAILTFIDKGRPIRILSPVMTEGAGLIVKSELPVGNWVEFVDYAKRSDRPLKIGYKSAVSVQNLIFEHALSVSNIPFSMQLGDPSTKINLINLNGAKHLIPAMENGLIDGFVVMQPYLAMAQTSGSGKLISLLRDLPPTGNWHGYPCCALAANEKFLESHPALAEAIGKLILRAKNFIIEHPDKSIEQIAHWLSLPTEIEARALPTIDFSAKLDDSWDRGIDFWLESMIESGRLNGSVRETFHSARLKELLYDRDLYAKISGETK